MTPTPRDLAQEAGGSVTLGRGALTLSGSVIAAASGFLLAVLVGRFLGTAGAGVFFSIVAFVTILTTALKLGADTAQLWRIPRLLSDGRPDELWSTVRLAVVPSAVLSAAAALVVAVASEPIADFLVGDALYLGASEQVVWAAAVIACMAPMAVLIAVTRGLGHIGPFVAVQNVGLPLGRLTLVAGVLAAGAGGVAVMAAWSLPVLVATVVAAALVWRQVRAARVTSPSVQPARPAAHQRREFWSFAIPRGLTASIEVSLIAVNTLLVGFAIGPAAAGVFGALSRFVTTGTMAEQAVRIVVAPRFSALLGTGDVDGANDLYARTTPWIVAASWPVFLVIATGAPALLAIFGPGFEAGAPALTLLAVAMCASQLAGNVQTVLLMSGHSGLQLLNKGVAVLVLMGLNLWLIPRLGLMGAAIAWSAALLTDTALAVVQVRLVVGIRLRSGKLVRVAAAAVIAFAIPTFYSVRVLDAGLLGLLLGVFAGGVPYAVLLWRWRHRLEVHALAAPSGPAPTATENDGPSRPVGGA